MATEVVFRRMRDSDLAQVMELEQTCYSTPWSETTFRGLLRRNDCDLLIATADGELWGYAVVWSVADQGELGNLATTPMRRRQGIGRKLLEAAIDAAARRGVNELFLEVRVSNHVARALYDAYDFREVGRRRNYYAAPVEDALVLCKRLGVAEEGEGQKT